MTDNEMFDEDELCFMAVCVDMDRQRIRMDIEDFSYIVRSHQDCDGKFLEDYKAAIKYYTMAGEVLRKLTKLGGSY